MMSLTCLPGHPILALGYWNCMAKISVFLFDQLAIWLSLAFNAFTLGHTQQGQVVRFHRLMMNIGWLVCKSHRIEILIVCSMSLLVTLLPANYPCIAQYSALDLKVGLGPEMDIEHILNNESHEIR